MRSVLLALGSRGRGEGGSAPQLLPAPLFWISESMLFIPDIIPGSARVSGEGPGSSLGSSWASSLLGGLGGSHSGCSQAVLGRSRVRKRVTRCSSQQTSRDCSCPWGHCAHGRRAPGQGMGLNPRTGGWRAERPGSPTPREGALRRPEEGAGYCGPWDHLLCGQRPAWPSPPLGSPHSLLLPRLPNPSRNPFPFSRISLLCVDLNAQGLQMRPEGGLRSHPRRPASFLSHRSLTGSPALSLPLKPSSQPSFL